MSFKEIFQKQINSITVAAALVAASSLASRLLGVVRDRILAGQFGAGAELDIYYAAFRIPDLIYNIIVLGALSAGFIPVFTGLIRDFKCAVEKGGEGDCNQEAWNLASNVLNWLLLGLAGLSALGIIFAPALTRLMVPGFSAESQAVVASLTRVMFLSPLFLGISGVLGGVLQSFKRFLVYSLAPVLYNIGIIIGALYFSRWWGIDGLAWGVAFGAFLHMAIQIPVVYRLGWRYSFKIKWRDSDTRQIGRMMAPRIMSLATAQINLVVITVLASGLSAGSLTVFNFANNLQSFPIGIFGISFAIAAFPALAETAFDKEKLVTNFSRTIRQIWFFIAPATVLIVALRAQLIRVVLGSGNFDWQDTILTMDCLGLFAISLFAQAAAPLLARVFYARHDSATPFYLGLASVAANIILSLFFAPRLGITGLVLAFSIASILNFILLWIWLSIAVGSLDMKRITISVAKFTVSAFAAGGAAQIMKALVWPFIDMTKFSGVSIQLLVSGSVGLAVYLVFCYLLRSEELAELLSSLRRRLSFKKTKVGDQGEAMGI